MFSAFVGPQLVIFTKDIWPPYLFAASYVAQAGVAVAVRPGAAGRPGFRSPPAASRRVSEGRPLAEIFRQPRLIVAVVCGVASYSMMNLVMTSAPVAMVDCHHSVDDATLGLQWHVVGMFAPSFFTGALIARFGTDRVVGCGLAIIAAGALIGAAGHHASGTSGSALMLLGVGWNFAFVGATAHGDPVPPPERAQQGAGVQRFPGVRLDGDRLVLVRPPAGDLRLDHGRPRWCCRWWSRPACC